MLLFKLSTLFKTFFPFRGGYIGLFFFLFSFFSYSQSSTRGQKNHDAIVQNEPEILVEHKVMLIPFEPKLFMCEIGKNIAKETNMNFDQIRNAFRTGLENSLLTQIKPKFSTVSLLADSNITYKDMNYIYESIGFSYDIIPEESANKKIELKSKNDSYQKKSGVKDGQLMVEANVEKRFMNTKISNKELLSYLNKKYETDVFLFINQLDIRNVAAENFDINSNGFEREITIHYTALDKSGKQLNAGIATSRFSSQLNEPKKIINNYVSSASNFISERLVETLIPPSPEEKEISRDKSDDEDKVK